MGTALFPHKSWSFKDKILRQIRDMVSVVWGELVTKNKKKREKSWSVGRQSGRDWGLCFPRWRPLGPLFSHYCFASLSQKFLYDLRYLQLSFCHFNQKFSYCYTIHSLPLNLGFSHACFPSSCVQPSPDIHHLATHNFPRFSQSWEGCGIDVRTWALKEQICDWTPAPFRQSTQPKLLNQSESHSFIW